MMLTPELLELCRRRWRRARQALRLTDPEDTGFGSGGLVRYAPKVRTRLLILPPDPEAETVAFEPSLWQWLELNHTDPATGAHALLGLQNQPTAMAAVRCTKYSEAWERYVALYRHGGMEVGLGEEAGIEWKGRTHFRLTTIVGRVWAALALYADVIARFELSGPWEVTLALRETSGASLGEFGAGWAEPGDMHYQTAPCAEPNLMRHWELAEWPDKERARELAFSIGDWLENAWGSSCHRYLAREGGLAGQFDTSRYRWA